MTARFASMMSASHCCTTSAAACSSARIRSIQDTAIILVVSIFVCLLNLRLRGMLM